MGCATSKQASSGARSPEFYHQSHRHRQHRHGHHHHHVHYSSSSSVKSRDNSSIGGVSSVIDSSSSLQINGGFGRLEKIKEESERESEDESVGNSKNPALTDSKSSNKKSGGSIINFSIKFGRLTEGEHAAAGWPTWLSAVAGEAIEGWLPLHSDSFERLEKIGQGTYSSVYRARNVETGRMVALKKVRFDNSQPESVRFMAREITILRRLDHPNIMKLEGIITSRASCSVYLVFEYMEHDLSGLLSCPDIKFTESQIKCYMKQLLCGVEHFHSRGVMHRDIKSSNILVNNDGILKIADFGLANFVSSKHKQPLTSRVVTLWYRPPELLLGSTSYGVTVDLWSVGCVFAELFIGRPLLKGRTEVEQLHKIFKLCGSPPDEYWKKSKLPLATLFKPQQPYDSMLRERCKELPKTAVNLMETLLSVEPSKRESATAALLSEYFSTKPKACNPSTLPKYPPNKEIDAKFREEARRTKVGGTSRASGSSRNLRRDRRTSQEPNNFFTIIPTEEVDANGQYSRRNTGASVNKGRATVSRASSKGHFDTMSQASHMTEESHADSTVSVPTQMSASSNLVWGNRHQHDSSSSRLYGHAVSRSHKYERTNPSRVLHTNGTLDSDWQANDNFTIRNGPGAHGRDQTSKHVRAESFDYSDFYQSQELSVDYDDRKGIMHSGPLLRQDIPSHQGVRRSRFYIDS